MIALLAVGVFLAATIVTLAVGRAFAIADEREPRRLPYEPRHRFDPFAPIEFPADAADRGSADLNRHVRQAIAAVAEEPTPPSEFVLRMQRRVTLGVARQHAGGRR